MGAQSNDIFSMALSDP